MTYDEAISVLIVYNKWRRGDIETLDKEMTPKRIGIAIDVVIEDYLISKSSLN